MGLASYRQRGVSFKSEYGWKSDFPDGVLERTSTCLPQASTGTKKSLAEGPPICTVAYQGVATPCVLRPWALLCNERSRNVAVVETLPSIGTLVFSASLFGVAQKHGGVGFDSSPNLATKHTIWLRPPLFFFFLTVRCSLSLIFHFLYLVVESFSWSLHCTSDPHGRVQNVGQRDFPDYDMLDAMIASAMKRLLDKHVHFRKRASVEEQRAQSTTDS